jgi:signal transduction histidine kinase
MVRAALAEEGLRCSIERVSQRSEYLGSLKRGGVDLILSEYQLPLFDGVGALAIAHELCRGTPFIVVSGTVGEEVAIEMLKSGATDYVVKRRIARLGPAVRRALDEVAQRAEHARLEGLLHQAQKMEIVGRLAGSVARGFNDLLTVILGHGQLLNQRLELEDPRRAECEEIVKAALMAGALSGKLLAVSRQQLLEPKAIDLHDTIRQMEPALKGLLGNAIELVVNLDGQPACVRVDPAQWEQVIMNLAMNGRDAMPQGGTFMVGISHVMLEAEAADQMKLASGPYVAMAVSDTGRGMDAQTRARLFEPFFTTKASGRGAGLGISAVQGIVEQSGGHIEVFSEVGRGTMIRILLPCLESSPSREAPRSIASPLQDTALEARTHAEVAWDPATLSESGPAPNPVSILLVEDEPMVRGMVSIVLRERGYRVHEATDGEEAVEFSQRNPSAITLLVTDVMMPRLGGPELYQRLVHQQPGMKVIYMSGHSDDRVFKAGLLSSGMAFLPKPFGPKDLLERVDAVLELAA